MTLSEQYEHDKADYERLMNEVKVAAKKYHASAQALMGEIRKVPQDITRREEQVLAMVRDGNTNREISEALGIAERTVKLHVSQLLRKFGVRARYKL